MGFGVDFTESSAHLHAGVSNSVFLIRSPFLAWLLICLEYSWHFLSEGAVDGVDTEAGVLAVPPDGVAAGVVAAGVLSGAAAAAGADTAGVAGELVLGVAGAAAGAEFVAGLVGEGAEGGLDSGASIRRGPSILTVV